MFAVTPFPALRMVSTRTPSGGSSVTWQPCRVVGIAASGDEPMYLIEIRGADGGFYLDRAEMIRKPEPKG